MDIDPEYSIYREKPLNVAMAHSKLERHVETKYQCEVVRCCERKKKHYERKSAIFSRRLGTMYPLHVDSAAVVNRMEITTACVEKML